MQKVLMLIKTTGLEYDDRVRKEAISISELNNQVKIIAVVGKNISQKGKTEYGVNYQLIQLTTRKLFPHKKFLLIKLIEMYLKFSLSILKEKPDIVWLHNIELIGLTFFVNFLKKIKYIKKTVWDQHELPNTGQFETGMSKIIFRRANKKCNFIISANKERVEYLKSHYKINANYIVLNNYPDKKFIDYKKKDLSIQTRDWLNDKEYIYIQGAITHGRFLEEIIKAVIQYKKLKLIIVGAENKQLMKKIEQQTNTNFSDTIFFTGFLSQFELISYIDNAKFSIVLYNGNAVNSYLCAPNRLYQALCREIPVIVGENPPMKNILNETNAGVTIKGYGENEDNILKGIIEIENNYNLYKSNAIKYSAKYVWNNQSYTLKQIF